MARRHSPTFFRRKGAAVAFFVICVVGLLLLAFVGYGLLTRYNYDEVLPEDAVLRAKFPVDDNYLPVPATPTPVPVVTPVPLPTPQPTPQPTPIPLQMYSLQNTRMVMPKNAVAPGEAYLTSMRVSAADQDKSVIVTGYAYLRGLDAEDSTVYLVVSSKTGTVHRFYQADILPGSTGIHHEAALGKNLERADFRAVFHVRTYEEGPYRLGALVVNRIGKKAPVEGYFDLNTEYQFSVRRNTVISVG